MRRLEFFVRTPFSEREREAAIRMSFVVPVVRCTLSSFGLSQRIFEGVNIF